MKQLDFSDKCVVVTGAGSGIGRASALRFAEHGASVIVSDIKEAAAADTVVAICDQGGEALSQVVDVTDPGQLQTLVDRAVSEYGRLDVMFNNAGGALPTPLEEIDVDEYRRLMALNFDGVYFGSVAALKVMLSQGGGCILSTTSGAGHAAVPGLSVYGCAKAAVNSLMRSIAVEYGRRGIRANAISPGAMDTPGLRSWLDTLPGGRQAYNDAQPTGRLGTSGEIADAAIFLASDFASFVNGSVLPVDGAVQALLASPQ